MDSRPPARPHVLCMPCPFHGHTTPFFRLATLLASHGITITFITTLRFQPKSLEVQRLQRQGLDIRIALIQDGMPPDYSVCVHDLPEYLRHMEMLTSPVEALVEKIMADPLSPPITCLISDSHLGWLQDVANTFKLPRICFLTSSTTEFSVIFHQPMLVSKGLLPFKGRNGINLDESNDVITCIPGIPPMHRIDFPSFMQVEDSSDFEFQYFMRQIARVPEAERLLVASFEELEAPVMKALREKIKVCPIGPIMLLEGDVETSRLNSSEGGEKQEDERRIEEWLDQQEERSVVFIAFGTLANLEEGEVRAIAGALEETGQRFVWALRKGLVAEREVEDVLPAGFSSRAAEEGRGLVVEWAEQCRVLGHRAVAAFLTHCGWGSTLESVALGVPLLCWPLYGDQLLNCDLLTRIWRAGVKISAPGGRRSITARHVVSAIATIFRSPEYRLNMGKLQNAARRGCAAGGSSHHNFLCLVRDLFAIATTATSSSVGSAPRVS